MQFRLRTLLIVLALGPPVLAAAWTVARAAYELLGFDPVSVVIVIALMYMLVALECLLVPIRNRK